MSPQTLLSPFDQSSSLSSPAIILPDSSSTPGVTLSYKAFRDQIDHVRTQLDQWDGGRGAGSLRQGDVVSMSLVNSAEFAVAFLAVGAHRCVAAPLNPAYNKSEVSFYLDDTKSKLVLVPHGAGKDHPAVQAAQDLNVQIAEIHFDGSKVELKFWSGSRGRGGQLQGSGKPQESDVALVLHTSGTTGRPKAVPLTHKNLATTMRNIVNTYKLSPKDRTYLVMPLFHVHGLLAAFLAPLLSGGSIVLPPKFSAGVFWKEFTSNKANWYTAVPTIHQILLRTPHPSPVPEIRFIRSCSSALSPTTFTEIEKAFKAPVLEAYAMTEAAHQMTSNPLPPAKRKPGTVGLGQGVEVRILSLTSDEQVEEGEVCIRGPNVTPGYINNEKANKESFTQDGFFRTGDRGKLDEDGYLILTGRIKELINKGGEKISPLEVDAALLSLDGVGEAVAFGVPDEKYGEKVWAAVVLKSDSKKSEQDIIKEVKQKISAFKCPDKVFILDAIPKTATGKIQRRNLATKFAKEDNSKAKL